MTIKKPLAINQRRIIHDLRLAFGLTQEQFAATVGVTYTTINRWENGRSKPSPLAMGKIEGMLEEIKRNEAFVAITRARVWCVATGLEDSIFDELGEAIRQSPNSTFPAFNSKSLKRNTEDDSND